MASLQNDVLDRIFQGLKNKNHDVRLESALELRHYVCPRPHIVSLN